MDKGFMNQITSSPRKVAVSSSASQESSLVSIQCTGGKSMSRRKTLKEFWLAVTDDEQRIVNIHGKMSDDTDWIDKVCEAKKSGRAVRCQSLGESLSQEEAIRSMLSTGYQLTERPIVDATEDRSSEYTGAGLPPNYVPLVKLEV